MKEAKLCLPAVTKDCGSPADLNQREEEKGEAEDTSVGEGGSWESARN